MAHSTLKIGLLWLVAWPVFAQQNLVLRGRVLDADSRRPLSNVQVGIGGNKLGTSTNEDGRFALHVPAIYQASELEVALLGYRRYARALPPLPGGELLIELKTSPTNLGTVAVSSSATGIVQEAVARIPRNYPARPTRLTGFFRESDNNAAGHEYHYLGEGILLVQKASYQRPNDNGEVKIVQERRVDLRPARASQPGLPRVDWYAGPLVPHRFDFVHNRAEFIRASQFKNYQYRLTPQATFQGRPVYVVAFGPRPGTDRANFAGELYIDEQSYAFLGAAWHRTPSGIRREHVLSFEAAERAYRVDYQKYAGRWYLKSIWYNTLGKPLAGQTRRHLAEYLTTAIDTAQAPPIPYPERAQYSDVFLQAPTPYDSTFWNHYTTLLPNSQLRFDLLDQERQQRAGQLLQKPAAEAVAAPAPMPGPKRRLGVRYSYAAGLLSVQAPAATLGVVVAPGGSAFRAMAGADVQAQALAGFSSFGIEVELPGQVAVYTLNQFAFGQLHGAGWEAGLSWEHNLNPRGRPMLGRLGLAYAYQQLGRALGTFDNPDGGLRVTGTALGADQLALSLLRTTEGIQPKIGLGIELNHRVEAVADLGYRWPLRTRTQLLLEEKRGFFRNEAALALPAYEVQLTVDQRLTAAAPWQAGRVQLSVGLRYRLGR